MAEVRHKEDLGGGLSIEVEDTANVVLRIERGDISVAHTVTDVERLVEALEAAQQVQAAIDLAGT